LLRALSAKNCTFREKELVLKKLVSLNENGRRIGESHPGAKLLDHEVEQVLELLDAGLSYAEVAAKFEVSKSCIAHIASGRRRGQAIAKVLRVSVKE
jgi:DNA-binding NarL/FixJ family response regulator